MQHAERGRAPDTSSAEDAGGSGAQASGAPVPPPPLIAPPPAGAPGAARASRRLRTVVSAAVALCLTGAFLHLGLVFLHVAPSNVVSQHYEKQIDGWVYPVFEQNWRLFAPDPESVSRQILVRTAPGTSTDPDVRTAGPWFDLSALDREAVRHHPAPSHTAQNMLRRAWTGYVDAHGGDDESRSERAVMMRDYLRNIAVRRVAAARGEDFGAIQLRVVTRPIPAPAAPGAARPVAVSAETRTLPWWEVDQDAR